MKVRRNQKCVVFAQAVTTTPETEAEADAPAVLEAAEEAPPAKPKSKKLTKGVKHIMQVSRTKCYFLQVCKRWENATE